MTASSGSTGGGSVDAFRGRRRGFGRSFGLGLRRSFDCRSSSRLCSAVLFTLLFFFLCRCRLCSAEIDVRKFSETGHSALGFARVHLGVDRRRLFALTDRTMRKTDLLVFVLDPQDLEVHFLADLRNIFRFFDPLVGELRNMAKAFETLAQFDKNAKACESRNLAANNIARTMSGDKAFPCARHQVLHRKRKTLAALVDVGDDRIDFLVLLQELFWML